MRKLLLGHGWKMDKNDSDQ